MEDRQCRSDAGSSRLEFKDEAVKMVIETARPIAEIARDIHVNEGTVGTGCTRDRARRRRAGVERLRAGSAACTGTRRPRVADEDGVPGRSGGLPSPRSIGEQ